MRLDKWLWAARFFKTRSLAVEAIGGGRVSVNGDRAKPAKELKVGDAVSIRRPPFEYAVLVKALSDKRGSAQVAAKLFEDHSPPAPPRTRHAPPPFRPPGAGRPTKRERRRIDRLR